MNYKEQLTLQVQNLGRAINNKIKSGEISYEEVTDVLMENLEFSTRAVGRNEEEESE